jgi:hypothetical protein
MIKKNEPANDGRRPYWVLMIFGLSVIIAGILLVSVAVPGRAEEPSPVMTPPPGLRASGFPETFSPDTLWEKINGQAEFYLSAGFVSLTSQLYERVEDVDSIIEVNAYHMGGILNAFSVFSLQQRDNAQAIDVARFAYQTENAVYLVHGPYYLEILWILPLDGEISVLKLLAEQFVRETPIKGEDLPQLALFPLHNLVKGSAALISKDAFGFEPLDNVFTVEYMVDKNRATAYISERKTAQEARAMVTGLHTYFKTFGGRTIKANIAIQDVRMIEIMGSFDLMFSMGEYFAGVHEAPTQKQAEIIAEMLAASLNKKGVTK